MVVQLELPRRADPGHGGWRPGAGRKRSTGRRGVPHRVRGEFRAEHPLHVTLRLAEGLPSLREGEAFRTVCGCIRDAQREGFAVVEFSVMRNHLHLIVEAGGAAALAKGMQGLKVRLSRRLNRAWRRAGTVFAERYHVQVLATPRQVRNALAYVLGNARRHAWHERRVLPAGWIDPCSSADTFAGWRERFPRAGALDEIVRPARTWLLRRGWRLHGLLSVAAIPGAAARVRA